MFVVLLYCCSCCDDEIEDFYVTCAHVGGRAEVNLVTIDDCVILLGGVGGGGVLFNCGKSVNYDK